MDAIHPPCFGSRMDTSVDLTVLQLRRSLVVERLKNCELLHNELVRRTEDLSVDLAVLNEEIAKRTPKPASPPAESAAPQPDK